MKQSACILVTLLGLGLAAGAWPQSDQEKGKPTKPGPNTPNPNNPGGPPDYGASQGSKGTKTTTATKTTTTKAKAHKVTGDISKLDCTAMTLTVGTTELMFNDHTSITVSGKKATCSDLKDGAKATVSYVTKDGKTWGTHISVR